MLELKDFSKNYLEFIFECNQLNKPQVGNLTLDKLQLLIENSCYLKVAIFNGKPAGFLLCLKEDQNYDSPNYQWVSTRYSNFIYIDRISIMPEFQNRKIGTAFYLDLITFSNLNNFSSITCEVNIQPPNPGSLRFHKRFDFLECGSQFTEQGTKEVQFLIKQLN